MRNFKLVTMVAICATAFPFAACSDDDKDIRPSAVPEAVKASMAERFPSVKMIDWERVSSYYVADFVYKTFDTEAWFRHDGAWAMTETDYNGNISFLPQLMQDAFNNSQYATWTVDDVDYYQREADTFCAIDVEAPGQGEMTLYIDNMGRVVNVTPDVDADIYPETPVESL